MSGNVFEFPGYIANGGIGADVKKAPENLHDPRHLSDDDFLLLLQMMSSADKKRPISGSGNEHKSQIDDLIRHYGVLNSPVDTPVEPVHTPSMNDITREEFNAKLETIEVKMDARVESVSAKIDGFLTAQAERDKAQLERDKRYEILADRAIKAAEGAEAAATQAATVKANYWAAVAVQLLAVVAILVGAYYANQANVFGAMQTTFAAIQSGKDSASTGQETSMKTPPQAPQPSK